MLIFHHFESAELATKFAKHVDATFGRKAYVCETEEEFDRLQLFPFRITLPVVLVERSGSCDDVPYDVEEVIKMTVLQFGGSFAGT
jgi:hypothetical protein